MLPGSLSRSRARCSERTTLSKIRFSRRFLSARTDGRHQTSNPHLHGNANAAPLTSETLLFSKQISLKSNVSHSQFCVQACLIPALPSHERAKGCPDCEDGGVVPVSHLSHDPMQIRANSSGGRSRLQICPKRACKTQTVIMFSGFLPNLRSRWVIKSLFSQV